MSTAKGGDSRRKDAPSQASRPPASPPGGGGQDAAREEEADDNPGTSALDERLRKLGDGLLSLHEHLRQMQDAQAMARHYLREGDHAVDVRDALDQADEAAWFLGCELGSAMAAVTGNSPCTPLPQLTAELASLVDELGGQSLPWTCSARDVRKLWSPPR